MSETNEDKQTSDTRIEKAIDQATEAVSVQVEKLDELAASGDPGEAMDLSSLLDVPVEVTIEVGRTKMSLGQIAKVSPGSLIELDREAHEPADVLVNGKIVAPRRDRDDRLELRRSHHERRGVASAPEGSSPRAAALADDLQHEPRRDHRGSVSPGSRSRSSTLREPVASSRRRARTHAD